MSRRSSNVLGVRRRPHLAVVVLVAFSLAASACGTEVSGGLRKQAQAAALGGGSGRGGLTGTGTVDGTGTGSGTGTTGAGAGTGTTASGGSTGTTGTAGTSGTAGAGGTGAKGGGGGAGGGTAGAPAPAGGNGGATDVGVTATSITVGNVSDLTGPQNGLFQSAADGTNAYFQYVNSQGGIYGRQLKIDVADSQTSCNGDTTGTSAKLKDFALAGSFSLFDNCGAAVLKNNPTVPDVHLAVTKDANGLPNNFSINPVGSTLNNGFYAWAKGKFGADAVQNAGFMWADLSAVDNVAALTQKTAASAGWKFTYTRAVGATETDFTSDILQMKQKGVKLFITLFSQDEMSNFKPQADQQSFTVPIIATLGYDATFIKKLGGASAANGIYGTQSFPLFLSKKEAASIPSVAAFQKFYAQATGGGAADVFAADGWAQAALLVSAIKAAGPKLTRAGVLAALRKTKSFNADGFTGGDDPADKTVSNCYLVWQIQNGDYVRVDTPATGFRCDGVQA